MQPGDPVVGSSTLRRPAIQSPNFVAGVSGWAINADGSAEFADLTISGGDTTVTVGPGAGSTGSIDIEPVAGSTAGGAIINFRTGQAIESSPANIESSLLGGGQVLGLQINGAGTTGGGGFPPAILLESQGTGGQGSSIQLSVSTHGHTADFGVIVDGASETLIMFSNTTFSGAITCGDTWHALSGLGANWAAGTSGGANYQAAQYRQDAEDNLIVIGAVHTTSNAPAGTIFTLPLGWRPVKNQRVPIVTWDGTTVVVKFVEVNSSGAITLSSNPAAANVDVYFQVCVPLGNIT